MPSQPELLEVAIAAAHRAGAIQMEMFGKVLNVDAKTADDVKLEADRLCERAIIDTIRQTYPTHAILAEESGTADGAEYIWYVDPLDGTVNFFYGVPYFCTTIACCRHPGAGAITPANMGEGMAAVTYAAPTGEMFIASPESGLTLNGRKMRVREDASLADAFLLTAYGNSEEKLRFTREVTLPLSPKVRKIRNLGALAYDLALVASGRASGIYQYGFQVWDVAAGRIMVEAAGGEFHARRYANGNWVMAAAGKSVQKHLLAALDAYR